MTIFDLLFLAVFFATVVLLIASAILALRGQSSRALRLMRNCGIGLTVYIATAVAVNALTPQRVLRLGEDLCDDDWCVAVTGSSIAPGMRGPLYTVQFRIHSRALRVDQRYNGVIVRLTDGQGRQFEPLPNSNDTPFNTLLHAGESVNLTRQFQTAPGAARAGVLISHSGPGWLVIGEAPFRHPVVWLDAAPLTDSANKP